LLLADLLRAAGDETAVGCNADCTAAAGHFVVGRISADGWTVAVGCNALAVHLLLVVLILLAVGLRLVVGRLLLVVGLRLVVGRLLLVVGGLLLGVMLLLWVAVLAFVLLELLV